MCYKYPFPSVISLLLGPGFASIIEAQLFFDLSGYCISAATEKLSSLA
jgi:hypothetical protein